jgi:putative two-component system response regulator
MVLKQTIHELRGCTCLEAPDGKTALQLWEIETPEILITDLEMPFLDGYSLIEEIRAKESDSYTYVIVLTGHDDEGSLARSFEVGADDFLPKPFDKKELEYRILAGERVLSLLQKQFVVYALAHLTEVRDVDSGKHIERIGTFSKLLANGLKLIPKYASIINRTFLDRLEIASILHDIGKVGIDDAILKKPSNLTNEEFAKMKEHTSIGYHTIEEIATQYPKAQYLKMAAEVARWHHERVDGFGYPDGLKGDEIPLAAKIVAVADVYDALVNERPYKKAFSFEEARELIKNGSGTQFDADVVTVFLDQEPTFRQVVLSHRIPSEQNPIS